MIENPTDLRALLEENIALAKENNRILKAMRRDALIGAIVKTLIWIVLVGGSLYFTLQFLAPYLAMLEELQQTGQNMDIQSILEEYRTRFGY